MARVTGIGGVFLKAKDPKGLTKWYADHLGITLTDYGGVIFLWKDEVPKDTGMTTWSTFPEDTGYFGPSGQGCMVNYRVDDMDALVGQLEAAGVWVDPKRDDSEYGKFAWIKDGEGNRVELWQPLAEDAAKTEESST